MDNSAANLYDFELKRRLEINENLRHTFQLSLAELGSLIYLADKLAIQNTPASLLVVVSFWSSFIACVISVILCTFAYMAFKTAYPNTAEDLNRYKADLKSYNEDAADALFSEFLEKRWAENATKNSLRNRQKSRLSFYGRIMLAISAIPLLVVVICYLSIRMQF